MSSKQTSMIKVPAPEDFIPLPEGAVNTPVTSLISNWAKTEPDRVAIVAESSVFTYHQMNRSANQIAFGLLKALGDGNHPVAILLNKEPHAIFASLGTLKSGNFYAGLDPTSPVAYLKNVCDDLRPEILLTSKLLKALAEEVVGTKTKIYLVEDWLEGMPSQEALFEIDMDATAAIYYTSGSTGKPKGVMVSQLGLWHRTFSSVNTLMFSPSDRTCMPFSISFGWSTTPLFGTLTTGGAVYLYDFAGKNPKNAAEWFIQHQITNAPIPAGFFKQFVSNTNEGYPSNFPDMRLIFVGGDSILADDLLLWQKLFSDGCILAYGFSSTEAGPITRTFYRTDSEISETSLKFGMPAIGVEILIVDDDSQPLPPGEFGEIALRTMGKMTGYWKQEIKNRQKFIEDPEDPGKTLLLSGDMGRLTQNKELEFLGRKDFKVKIRGFLVDLKTIETTLSQLPEVSEVAIKTYRRKKGDLSLAAYLAFEPGTILQIKDLKKLLARELPTYMVPHYFCILDKLPRSTSGKVNSHLLPEPNNQRPSLDTPYIPPQDELEIKLANIWQEVLEISPIGTIDNFFDLGGDSLSALEMTLEVEKLLDDAVPQIFFQQPTIQHLKTLLNSPKSALDVEDISNKFDLKSYKTEPRHTRRYRKSKGKEDILKRVFRRRKLGKSIDHLIDLAVARYITSLPYQKASGWIVRWSNNQVVRKILYGRRYELFDYWLKDINGGSNNTEELFQRSMITNLNYRLRRYKTNQNENEIQRNLDIQSEIAELKNSPSIYWSSLGELIESTPLDKLDEIFPIVGLHHLTDAIAMAKGVILLSFHGMMAPLRFLPLKWRLGTEITTISYQMALAQSNLGKDALNSRSIRSSMNAELALFGHRILQNGGVINILGDSSDPYGKEYQITVGGRAYPVKTGFAELAINSGAVVIPHFGRVLPDGRPEMIILPPLEDSETIEQLMQQYQAFINDVWIHYPEVVRWVKIQNHYKKLIVNTR